MTQFLPPNLLSLFFPREPLPFKIPPTKKKCSKNKQYTGVASFLDYFDEHREEPPVIYETRFERRERKLRERQENERRILEEKKSLWNPKEDSEIDADPFKTLFVARLSYDTTESKLKREFEVYGPIRAIKIIKDKCSGKPRGYAFIEYEHKRDMHAAYKHMDGKKIDGRRILVDAERGRLEKNWLPRYLGGGLGGNKRATSNNKNERNDAPKPTSDSFQNQSTQDDTPNRKYDDSYRHRRSRSRDSRRNDKHDTHRKHRDDERRKYDRDRR